MDPFFDSPDHDYRYFQKCLRKGEYRKAYRCCEKRLKSFPDDDAVLVDIINLCLDELRDPAKARFWLLRRIRHGSTWRDRALLAQIERDLGDFDAARDHLKTAKALARGDKRDRRSGPDPDEVLSEIERSVTRAREIALYKRSVLEKTERLAAEKPRVKAKEPNAAIQQELPLWPASDKPPAFARAAAAPAVTEHPRHDAHAPHETGTPARATPAAPPPSPAKHRIAVEIAIPEPAVLDASDTRAPLAECRLLIDYHLLDLQRSFEDLVCLGAVKNVERYWYQVETARKAMRQFQGRVLLCDEVGLGKSIEAGMIVKEYLLRGMAKNVLVLVPSSLVSQWKEEMAGKFGIEFATTEDPAFQKDHDAFWDGPFLIASIHTAKRQPHFDKVTARHFDLVIVDEAHHLRNRSSLAWRLVNEIKKRFLLLLSATPVQNDLVELFNLITLLKPGQFGTERRFRDEYMQKGSDRVPANKEKLRALLREVMVRNTRSAIDLKLPRRFATTIRREPSEAEHAAYEAVSALVRERRGDMPVGQAALLMREAGSSPFALRATLGKLAPALGPGAAPAFEAVSAVGDSCKDAALLEILRQNPGDKKVVFAQYLKSLDHICRLCDGIGVRHARFSGGMTAAQKDEAIGRFREDIPVLVSSESGGEGRNMQFCNTIVNYDLPWNPMRIEQRIGRLHRIGQTREVFVFNLSMRGTIEDHVLRILDEKINMFEMVIGEIEPILGAMGEDAEFEDLIMEVWLRSAESVEAGAGFDELGEKLASAKTLYLETKRLDDEILGEDYES